MADEAGRPRRNGLANVARLAGVGLATVDRVLNERGGVSASTARQVIEAARQLGLRRVLPSPYSRQIRIEALLARSEAPFFTRLTQAFARVAGSLDSSVTVLRSTLDQSDPWAVAQRIRAAGADGLIVYCAEHPAIQQAIAAVTAAGTPVLCLVTDVPDSPRIAYVGINHRKAGRTAGFFTARMARRPGPALVVTNGLGHREHKEREAGFREGLSAHAPDMPVAEVLQANENRDRAYALVGQALRRIPNLCAIYNTGGANRAVAAALREAGAAGRVLFVGHELTEFSAALLQEGVMTLTIDQAPELQARRSVEAMLKRLGFLEAGPPSTEIPFTLHTLENT